MTSNLALLTAVILIGAMIPLMFVGLEVAIVFNCVFVAFVPSLLALVAASGFIALSERFN